MLPVASVLSAPLDFRLGFGKLLAKNSPTGLRGESETAILATGGKVLPGSRTRFRGAHTGQRWPLRSSICGPRTADVKRPRQCAITQKSPTPFSGGGSRQHRYREYPAMPKQRGNRIPTPVNQPCASATSVASAPRQQRESLCESAAAMMAIRLAMKSERSAFLASQPSAATPRTLGAHRAVCHSLRIGQSGIAAGR